MYQPVPSERTHNMIRYYINTAHKPDLLIEPGDPVVWRGEYSQHSTTDEPIILVRLLFDYDAPLFPVHKNTLVEFVPAKDLEEIELL